MKSLQQQQQTIQNIASVSDIVKTNVCIQQDFLSVIFQTNSQRALDKNHYYNIFIQYIGIDNIELYQNRLYTLKEDLIQKQKCFMIEEDIKNPSIEESNYLRLIRYDNKK